MMNVKKKGSKRMTMKIPGQTLGGLRATTAPGQERAYCLTK